MGGSKRLKQHDQFFARGVVIPFAINFDNRQQGLDGLFIGVGGKLCFGQIQTGTKVLWVFFDTLQQGAKICGCAGRAFSQFEGCFDRGNGRASGRVFGCCFWDLSQRLVGQLQISDDNVAPGKTKQGVQISRFCLRPVKTLWISLPPKISR